MKPKFTLLLFVFIYCANSLLGQHPTLSLDNCGTDDNLLLNKYESEFLNMLYHDYRGDFDFTGKRLILSNSRIPEVMLPKRSLFNEAFVQKFNKSGKVPFLGNIIILQGDDYIIADTFDVLIFTEEKNNIFGKNSFFCPPHLDEVKELFISEYANKFFGINRYSERISIDSCGIDENILLNKYESIYLNTLYHDYRGDFDFTGKRVVVGDQWGYLSISDKVKILPKITIFNPIYADAFNRQLYTNHSNRYAPYADNVIILSGDDFEITNAFDVLIIAHEKMNKLGADNIQPPYEDTVIYEIRKIIISNYAKLFE